MAKTFGCIITNTVALACANYITIFATKVPYPKSHFLCGQPQSQIANPFPTTSHRHNYHTISRQHNYHTTTKMYFTTGLTLAFAAITSLPLTTAIPTPQASTSSLVTTPNQTYHIEISSLPAFITNSTVYLTYARNFFGEYALQPSFNKSLAVLFTLNPDNSLTSTAGMGIQVLPLADPTYTIGQLNFTTYSEGLGTMIKGDGSRKPKKIVSTAANWTSWLFTESQYGAGVGWAATDFNKSEGPNDYDPSYEVDLLLRK